VILSYLTETEAEMPLDLALLQISLGLQTCKTKGDVVNLLGDAVELGRRKGFKEALQMIRNVRNTMGLNENKKAGRPKRKK
jgi:hypothetical protein